MSIFILLFMFVTVVALSLANFSQCIFLFIFLSPFHFFFKELFPFPITDVWRDIYLVAMIYSWFIQVLSNRLKIANKNLVSIMILFYLLWGVIETLNSVNLLTGLVGFRFMFVSVPLFFIAFSTIKSDKEIKRYLWAFLASGFIITVFALLQFVLVSLLHVIPMGTSIDFGRKYSFSGSLFRGFIALERSTSLLSNPNELGNFLLVCFILGIVLSYFKADKNRFLVPYIILVLLGLFTAMSRTALVGLVVSVAVLIVISRKKELFFKSFMVFTCIVVVFSSYIIKLFRPILDLSDPYFINSVQGLPYWKFVKDALFLGHGFSATQSTAMKLGIKQFGNIPVGAVDVYFIQMIIQIGLVGFLFHFFICLLLMMYSYMNYRNKNLPYYYRTLSLAVLGVLLAFLVVGLHTSPWEYVSLSSFYYILAAIVVFIYQQGMKKSSLLQTGPEQSG
ncbi:MAG: hypothetical protein PHF84_00590 [bacterium]|nr:hypothetical protein [bacterium]